MAISPAIIAAGVGAAGAIGGSLISSGASHDAANTQAQAATAASQEQLQAAQLAANTQLDIYGQTKSSLAPFVGAGTSALSSLSSLLGLGGQNTSGLPTTSQIFSPLANVFGVNNGGVGSASSLAALQQMPGYQWAFGQGQQALDRSAASRGQLLSGGQLKATTQYGQNMGEANFQNYVNDYLNGVVNPYAKLGLSPLQDLTSLGQNAAAMTGNAGSTAAANAGNFGVQGANNAATSQLAAAQASAAGTVGSANAITGGLSSGLQNSLLAYQLFNNPGSQSALTVPGADLSGLSLPQFQTPLLGGDGSLSLSDRRAKTDIKRVGKTDGGLPIYTYRIKGDDRVQMGVMADEVETKKPSAVKTTRSGLKAVDYSKISPLAAYSKKAA